MESSYTTLIGSRGWHVYRKSTWKNPKKREVLSFKLETDSIALRFDPHSIAITRKSIEYLVPVTVGHIPLEISRHVYFFMEKGGKLEAQVDRVKCEESPIPKGGLEIITSVTFKIEDSKKRYLERLIKLIGEDYETPIETTNNSAVNFDDEQDTDKSDDFDIDDKDIMFFIDDGDEKEEEEEKRSEGQSEE